jgi:hypothetical protein
MSPTNDFPTNEHNIVQYPKSDPRRLFVLLYALETLDRPTINTISTYTGLNKGLINTNINNLIEFYGLDITKDGPVYAISSWGDILNKTGVMRCVHGE